jgi:ParB-like partition proteins
VSEHGELGIVEVDVDQIIVPQERVTSVFDPETWEEFLESVKSEGIKVPIIVMNVGGRLYLIDGLHRIKAAKELGIKRIKALVRQGTEDDLLVENIITARLRGRENPAQTAKVVKQLRDRHGYSWNDIARRLGMSPATVKMYYDITRLPEQVLNLVGEGKLSVSKARLLLEIPNRVIRSKPRRTS